MGGTEGYDSPKWLKPGDAVEVDIARLEHFAERMNRELKDSFQPSFEVGINPMVQKLAKLSPFGKGGLGEGQLFRAYHGQSLGAVAKMLADVELSLMALGLAARSIAADYAGGDAMSKATIDDVSSAFAPTEGKQQSLAGLIEEGRKKAEADGSKQLPVADKTVPPADPDAFEDRCQTTADTNPGPVRGTETIGAGTDGEFVIRYDDEGVETRFPQNDIPRPPRP
jgi:hypothetical protein